MKTYKDYIMEATFPGVAGYLSSSDYEYDISEYFNKRGMKTAAKGLILAPKTKDDSRPLVGFSFYYEKSMESWVISIARNPSFKASTPALTIRISVDDYPVKDFEDMIKYERIKDAALALRYLRQYTKTESELNKILDFVKKNKLYHF